MRLEAGEEEVHKVKEGGRTVKYDKRKSTTLREGKASYVYTKEGNSGGL